jgi:sec-independent protein translocase protein TatA
VLNGFGWPHLLIIAALIIILFGAKRLPDAARGLGKSMHIFRSEMRDMHAEEDAKSAAQPAQQPQVAPQQIAPPAQQPTVAQSVSTEQAKTQGEQHA